MAIVATVKENIGKAGFKAPKNLWGHVWCHLKNAQGLAAGTHQIWIQLVHIDIKQLKELLYIKMQGWPKNSGF